MHAHADPPAVTTDHEVDELAPDEPHTPAWLTLVGGLLFLGGIVTFVALRPPAKSADELQKESAAAAEERAQARAAEQAPPAPAAQPMPGQAAPGAPGAPAPAPGRGG
jgi:predicted lipid-binding transport protein (Tim44 family)